MRESWRRSKPAENISRFRHRAEPLTLSKSQTPIQPIVISDNARALATSESLAERGFLVRAIRPPTVPGGTARLRVTLSTAHQPEQIDRLVRFAAAAHAPFLTDAGGVAEAIRDFIGEAPDAA